MWLLLKLLNGERQYVRSLTLCSLNDQNINNFTWSERQHKILTVDSIMLFKFLGMYISISVSYKILSLLCI